MLSCESCNYIKTMKSKDSNESKCVCEFTGFVFHEKIEDYEMENHPCYNYKVEVNSEKPVASKDDKLRIA